MSILKNNNSNPQELTDIELCQRILDREQQLFEVILQRYERMIFGYCMKILNNNIQDCEDVVSETFFKIYKNIASYNPNHKFSSWAYRIAHNTAVNLIKKKSGLFFVDMSTFWDLAMPSKEESIFDIKDLERVLDKLKFEDKNILVLFYIQEKTLAEIADILNITSNTVAQKLSRSRKKAKRIITQLYDPKKY